MKLIVGDISSIEADLDKLGGREAARRIVEAGSAAAVKHLQQRTDEAHHVVTGQMRASFAPGIYHEDIDRCWQDVYPQGRDAKGTDNAKKAFVINYGRGGRRTKKTGDKFITGKSNTLEEAVSKAMTAEAERIREEIMR
jgi:hypothetical protein